ncbi:hypothetical protein [Variovorax sp. PAMC 28711]|uniref:hypothetical protein n=1 Tax=Variovorax sp. PAMC 28711 TaxID=1795631 RepID=UPI00078D37E4|nr:hypothetical protein [Variovorax sp. PAMC 28711]AMM23615.1 hypothetical protein AX767_04110 [Variovorax sp. PAMC 28711]
MLINIFETQRYALPLRVGMLERHPLVVTQRRASFVVIDRGGSGPNCDEIAVPAAFSLSVVLPASSRLPA